jgi:hypothetical protein
MRNYEKDGASFIDNREHGFLFEINEKWTSSKFEFMNYEFKKKYFFCKNYRTHSAFECVVSAER